MSSVHDPFLVLQHVLSHGWLDPVMVALSHACEGWFLFVAALVIVAAKEGRRGFALSVLLPLACALCVDGIVVQILKHVLDLPRPLAVLGPSQVRVLGERLRAHSMPSGHASAAATFATFLSLRYGRVGALSWIVALGGGLARVYVGAHWARDVVVGWAIGVPFGVAAWRIAARPLQLRGAQASASQP